MRRLTVWLLTLFIVFPLPLCAQEQQRSQQDDERVVAGTTEVLLDVIVKDKKGRPIGDLKASDFQITEDGVAQEAKSFRLVSGTGEAAANSAPAATRAEVARRVRQDFNAGRIGTVAIVFDRLSLDSRKRAHDAALSYLTGGLQPNDFVGVFGIDQRLSVFQTFTNNDQLIRQGVDRAGAASSSAYNSNTDQIADLSQRQAVLDSEMLKASAGAGESTAATAAGGIGAIEIQRTLNRMSLESAEEFERLEQTEQGNATLGSMLALISSMSNIPGRKAILFFSEGVLIPSTVAEKFRTVIANANRANVSIYTIDAAGLRAESEDVKAGRAMTTLGQQRAAQAQSANDSFGSMMKDSERNEELVRHSPDNGLGQIADQTGGFLVSGTNNPGPRLRQANDDLHTYYVLTYSPKNQNFDGKFRQISVKVNRGGTDVQTRKGYYGLPTTYDSPVLTYEAPALALLGRGTQPSVFDSKVGAFNFPASSKAGLTALMVEAPASKLNFTTDAQKKTYHADFSIVVLVKDANQHVVRKVSRQFLLDGALDQLENAKRGNVLFYRETDLPPGEYTLDSIVYDATNGQASLNHGQLSVADADETKLRMSNLVVVNKAEKAGANDSTNNPFRLGDLLLYPNLGEPLHKAGSRGLSMFITLYPAKAATAPPKLMIELDMGGKPAGQLPVQLPKADESGRVQYTGTIPIDAFPPGDYELKAKATDGTTEVTRSARFTVAP
jgi:VWFA-related protein